MSAIVLDASAYVHGFTEATASAASLRRRVGEGAVHAPHLLVAEVGSVVRRLTLAGALKPERAMGLIDGVSAIVTRQYTHGPLARLAWALRANLSFYDGLYVALATTLSVPLLTADARLARAPGLPCAVEVIS
ncbi:type II toxin-antitoxin system VapC family toxin [Pseudonocardia nigra]|uniref:type II toxin-antitoxin system VapC family toxin n=1 Tax=Pseudonocardia nigra TaxID=1921578 RepID=UPI001C5FD295|nr:type II toxin-antitoxin system VapC family toxin [Pseudonocardia nigra]